MRNCSNCVLLVNEYGEKQVHTYCLAGQGLSFSMIFRHCCVSSEDIATAEQEEYKRLFLENAYGVYDKPTRKQALDNILFFKAGMSMLDDHRTENDNKCSADDLKNSSCYKCALPEEREAILTRHYELEIAKLKEQLVTSVGLAGKAKENEEDISMDPQRANDEIGALEVCNKKLQGDNDELQGTSGSTKGRLSRAVEISKEALEELEPLAGKWRLLDQEEPIRGGDEVFLYSHLLKDGKWYSVSVLTSKGLDKAKTKKLPIRRKITFE